MTSVKLFSIILFTYFLGCINTGYYYMKFLYGKDIRTLGSGNAGATNVARIAGKKGFLISFCGDVAKGCLAMAIPLYFHSGPTVTGICLFSVVAGHVFPIQLNFKGGKGLSVAIGAFLFLDYRLILLLALTFAILFVLCRVYKISALLSFVFLPIEALFILNTYLHILSIFLVILLILFAHRKNIVDYIKT